MKTALLVLLVCLLPAALSAQRRPTVDPTLSRDPVLKESSAGQGKVVAPSLKKSGHYTVRDWHQLIDSLWGEGVTTAQKLSVFDSFWNNVDEAWGGFPNLVINWDSLRSVYRPQVEAGVSRGRFAGILSRLTRELLEWHVGAVDLGIDSAMGLYPDLLIFPIGYPNYSLFRYKPGVPIININILFWRTNFGAGLTLLDDGTIMVYNVIPNHPLSLQPGDIILGYDGIPWKQLIKELFDAELPILSSGCVGNWLGSTVEAANHATMISAGMNWGLFDTIDVVKYSTKDTVHYPTSLLNSLAPPYLIATEQMPVNGVPFPDLDHNKLLSWGIVQGTNVGYIYGWDWSGNPWGETKTLFGQAVYDLIHQHHVQALILDFRTNPGGWPEFANDGFARLFNFDPTPNYSQAIRVRGTDHFAFTLLPPLADQTFVPTQIFDHPIAVLTGPLSGSSGDYNAFRLRFHPMVRFFGRPTCGAYTAGTNQSPYGTLIGPYFYRIDDGSVYSNVNDEGYMIHKPFPVDEEVWLTQEGVARGEDDVVKRALEWINSLSYAYDVAVNPGYARPGLDSVGITATLANPLQHAAAVSAIVADASAAVRDSVLLYNDGLHGDGSAGDSVWGAQIRVPSDENVFGATVRTDDITQGTCRRLSNAARFATAGPLTLDTVVVTKSEDTYTIKPYLKNNGASFTIPNVSVSLSCIDPGDVYITPPTLELPSAIPPGGIVSPSAVFYVYTTPTFQGYFNLKFEMATKSYVCWTDSTRLTVTGVTAEEVLPVVYELAQNYPNPFNPSTAIRYGLPQRSHVTLTLFSTLGQQVAVLQEGEQEAGYHEAVFDASGLASGVYLYRLQAGDFVQARRLLLLK
ncbi:MAG: T9SS C-terminal target domain-containing protein [Nitrospiraceae bacterium]|nr:MAG: T9SS C-terminal target domain-containing protein [Nitrospiraceae bacterium]